MRIKDNRAYFKESNKRLRRARRLYVAINIGNLETYMNIALDKMVENAVKAGLYSECTSVRNVYFSILRHHYQVTKRRDKCLDWKGWYDWLRLHNINLDAGYIDKPKLKITGVLSI